MRKLFFLSIIVAVAGCQSQNDKTTSSTDSATNKNIKSNVEKPLSVAGCYMEVLKRDTFTAHLQQQDNKITGKLVFNNYEKDKSAGTVSGVLEADILKLSYRFSSEGMSSVMEVYFKYKDGNLIRGIGEIKSMGDSVFFTNKAAIVYEGSEFKGISCNSIPSKYR